MSIQDKIQSSFEAFNTGRIEDSFEQSLIALDATARKVYPKLKNRDRMEKLLHDEMDLITLVGTGFLSIQNINFSVDGTVNKSIESVLYTYVRNSLIHEAEISDKVKFDDNSIGCEDGKFIFPRAISIGICMAVIGNPLNARCWIRSPVFLACKRKEMNPNFFWGKRETIRSFFSKNNNTQNGSSLAE